MTSWNNLVIKPFAEWTVREKVEFLHELLDHYHRKAFLGSTMLKKVSYDPLLRYAYGVDLE